VDALEKMLVESGTGTAGEIREMQSGKGLGLFLRFLVGLDKQAAKHAFHELLAGKTLTASQIQFVNLVIDYLTQGGWPIA
jgi:type I restriction enzyme, R subunit